MVKNNEITCADYFNVTLMCNAAFHSGGFQNRPKSCSYQRTLFSHNQLPVEPTFDALCNFKRKQCNKKRCWCVDPQTGKITSDGAVSKDEDCSSEWDSIFFVIRCNSAIIMQYLLIQYGNSNNGLEENTMRCNTSMIRYSTTMKANNARHARDLEIIC